MADMMSKLKRKMVTGHPALKGLQIGKGDVGKIFVIRSNGEAEVLLAGMFFELPLEDIVCWKAVSASDINFVTFFVRKSGC
jgi:hypothetical protein